jgi:V/A-type H+-transporting ATPase subunit E
MVDPLQGRTEHGVRELILRLEEEGIEAGRREAARLLAAAEQRAAEVVFHAEQQAAALREATEREAAVRESTLREALRLAARDTVHRLKEELDEVFGTRLRRHVADALATPPVAEVLITRVARALAAAGEADDVRIVTHDDAPARRLPLDDEAALDGTVAAVLRELVADGVALGAGRHAAGALRILMAGGDLQLELDEQRLTELLRASLSPRLRAVLDGLPTGQ